MVFGLIPNSKKDLNELSQEQFLLVVKHSIMNQTFAEKIITFNQNLNFTGKLPPGFQVMNPFADNPETMKVMSKFYGKYYDDLNQRKFIIGINPSRHGAGVTGIPFTDTKRLEAVCGIQMNSAKTHEISSVFMYEMMEEYGGVDLFYRKFFINSPFPLAIVQKTKGKWLNANYYDDKALFQSVKNYMVEVLQTFISFGLDTSEVFVLGKKNSVFIHQLNQENNLFEKMTVLEHPRYIQQYKSKEKQIYLDKYILAFENET